MPLNYDKWDAIDDSEDEDDRQARDAAHNQTMMLLGLMLADVAPHLSEHATARLVRFIAVVSSSPWTDAAQQREMARTRGKLIVDLIQRDGEPSLPALVALCRDAKAKHDAYVAGQRGDGHKKEGASRALIACMAALNILSAIRSYDGGAPKFFARMAKSDEEDDAVADIAQQLGSYKFAKDALEDYPAEEDEHTTSAAPASEQDGAGGARSARTADAPDGGGEWGEEEERIDPDTEQSPERLAAIKRAAEMIAAKRPPSSAVAAAEQLRSGETSALRSFARTFSRQLLMQAGFIAFGLVLGVVLRYLGLGKEAKPHLPVDRLLSYLGMGDADAREL